ncbi:MAG: hypothetical protein ACT4PT_13760 [Methanobacteriota archaeon]
MDATRYGLLLIATAAVAGCVEDAARTERVVPVLAVEHKGTAGAGERLAQGTAVNAYAWAPSHIAVKKGEAIVLRFYGVNGGHHPTTLEGHAETAYRVLDASGNLTDEGVGAFPVYRGHVTEVRFTADAEGLFRLICGAHQPWMTGQIEVTA